ncbi:CACTA transposable element [Tanacetum coccineum]
MTIDKSWTTLRNRTSSQFNDGLDAFLERCKDHLDEYNSCWCPCRKCNNNTKRTIKEIDHDIVKYGFSASYMTWDHHGEQSIVNRTPETYNDMVDFLHDVRMENTDEPTEGPSTTNVQGEGSSTINEPPETKIELEELLAKAGEKLYPDNKAHSSHYEAKKTFKKIGLGYESIHACINGCCLFWKENKFEHNCPVCGESRWKNENTKGKKVPKKVLRYFPLTPRLRCMYNSRHIAKYMTWHATGKCKEDGKMCHPVDGKTWKDFDQKHKQFALEPRNVRLGLAADGFNPFGNLSQGYSMWPVILTTYNLPPWLCIKESNLMLSMLIPGPKSPVKDIDV